MPATPPRRLPAQPPEGPWPSYGPGQAGDPWLDEPPGPPPEPDDDVSGPPLWLADDPGDVIAWLDAELAKAAPWLAADPGWDDPVPPGPAGSGEVFKAGRWDRSRGDGGGFAAGGLADHLPPGPVLAGLAADRWQAGLGRLTDDELIGMLRAARRLASWAAAMELAAVGDLWRRRTLEEDAGDTGAAVHADAEIAAALTLTRHAADQVLDLAAELRRLPATRAALAAGDIDLPRAKVIADEVTGLTDEHAAAVDAAIIAAAGGQTTGQLRQAVRRAVLAADPAAARRRKEQALRQARVERWSEPAGTAALAGRDLPPAAVLAADANLTALAKQLKAAGGAGTMDALRAQIYLALLTGAPVSSLLPADGSGGNRGNGPDRPVSGDRAGSRPGSGDGGTPDSSSAAAGGFPGLGVLSPAGIAGRVNLTLPLATWLGQSDGPGHAAGYGPLDATDSRALAAALAARAGTRWCLTLTGPDGRPVAHGCARAGSQPGRRFRPRAGPDPGTHADSPVRPTTDTDNPGELDVRPRGDPATGPSRRPRAGSGDGPCAGSGDGPRAGSRDGPRAGSNDESRAGSGDGSRAESRDGPRAESRDGPPAGSGDGPRAESRDGHRAGSGDGSRAGSRDGPCAGSRDGPQAYPADRTWTFTLSRLTSGDCDHAWETPAYRPSAALRHRVEIRHVTCVFPGCRRPAAQCDADHTIAYQTGGKTCLCNLAPLCRYHHEVKQASGWSLEQASPGTLTWTTPSGRRYRTIPTRYPR